MTEFVQINIDSARDFLAQHHCGVLSTWRKDGSVQMSPITPGLDSAGRVIISSRETVFKVKNLRRNPHASLCAFTAAFHGGGWVQVNGTAAILSLPEALEPLVYLKRQTVGEQRNWDEFRHRMERERRVIIRITIESVGPLRRG
jgi:PPOX class probable F420-dependent enzyme